MSITIKQVASDLINIEDGNGNLLFQVSCTPNYIGDDHYLGDLFVLNNINTEDEVPMCWDELPKIAEALITMYERFKGPQPTTEESVS